MKITGKAVLVTGANRGIGRALVEEALSRGAKPAAFSLTQSSRTLFARQGVSVHAVLTGPVDTDAARGFDIPKASPGSVARAIFDGVENEEEDIFPDPMSQSLAESWRNGSAKGFEP